MDSKMTSSDRRNFVAGSALGLAAAIGLPRTAAAQLTASEAANVRLVADFCASWSTLDLAQVTSFMTDESIYRMSQTTPPVTGPAGVIGIMESWFESSSAIEFRILETFAKGPLVVNHRIDTYSSDTRPLVWEGVGVFFLEDGRIKEWSDYTMRVDRA
jgi:limonene-1,2-epoxide hydrolase